MNRISFFLVCVTLLLIALYWQERSERMELADAVVALEASARHLADSCEERLAEQRFELEEQLSRRHGLDGVQALNDLQETLRSQRLRTQGQTLHEMSLRLDLSVETGRVVSDAVNAFVAGKRQLVSETRADGTFLTEAHLEKVDQLRRQVLEVIGAVLTKDQWDRFVEYGFIERLDLQMSGD